MVRFFFRSVRVEISPLSVAIEIGFISICVDYVANRRSLTYALQWNQSD